MNVRILTILAIGLLAGPMMASATLVTELFQVTLPLASGGYSAGHVFVITATYDDAGTVMNTYNDGPNDTAEFGSGDDTLKETLDLSVDPYTGYSLFSNAKISISGLAALPAGATPLDSFSENYSLYNECCGSTWEISYQADHLYLYMLEAPGDGVDFTYFSRFLLNELYVTAEGQQVNRITSVRAETSFISREPVPEPATLSLLGIGLAGLGIARRRKAH